MHAVGGIYLEKGETNQECDGSPAGGRTRKGPILPTINCDPMGTPNPKHNAGWQCPPHGQGAFAPKVIV